VGTALPGRASLNAAVAKSPPLRGVDSNQAGRVRPPCGVGRGWTRSAKSLRRVPRQVREVQVGVRHDRSEHVPVQLRLRQRLGDESARNDRLGG
jgi:hypothetical protein